MSIVKLRNRIIPFKLTRLHVMVTRDGGKLTRLGELSLTHTHIEPWSAMALARVAPQCSIAHSAFMQATAPVLQCMIHSNQPPIFCYL